MQEKYLERQMVVAQIRELQKQIETVEEKMVELATASQALDDLASSEKGADMLAPISDGIFVKASLEDPEELIVNVGSGVCIPKKIPEAKKMLKERLHEIASHREAMIAELQKAAAYVDEVEQELEALAGELKNV